MEILWEYLWEISISMHLKSKSICDIYERMFCLKIIESLQKVDYGMRDIALRIKWNQNRKVLSSIFSFFSYLTSIKIFFAATSPKLVMSRKSRTRDYSLSRDTVRAGRHFRKKNYYVCYKLFSRERMNITQNFPLFALRLSTLGLSPESRGVMYGVTRRRNTIETYLQL